MKEYSMSFKAISVISAIIFSYFLTIFSYRFTLFLLDNLILWVIISFGGALLCIIGPVLIIWRVSHFKLRYLLWVFPVIFVLVLMYSPSGFYFIIPKGGLIVDVPASENWKFGIAISIMFYMIQFFSIRIAIANQKTDISNLGEIE